MNLLFKCSEETFSTIGFDDWKHGTACYKKHEDSASHHESTMKWIHHIKGVAVDAQLISEKQKQQVSCGTRKDYYHVAVFWLVRVTALEVTMKVTEALCSFFSCDLPTVWNWHLG